MDNQIYYCSSCMITVISNEENPKCTLCKKSETLDKLEYQKLEQKLVKIHKYIDKLNKTKNTDLFGNELIVVNDICMHVKRVINR